MDTRALSAVSRIAAAVSRRGSFFDGSNPNGRWRVFVQGEDPSYDPCVFAAGWELEITAKGKAKKMRWAEVVPRGVEMDG